MKRIAVAGLGLIGARHAKAVAAHGGALLAAVIDPNQAARDAWDAPGFKRVEDVHTDIDGIILATPSHLHADHAEAALARGWPCLIEKPIEVSLSAADRIVQASKAAGLPVLTGHHRRYHASVHAFREIIAARIGQPVMVNAHWALGKPAEYFQGNWRAGAQGSPVMINMVHDLDLLRFLMGEVDVVHALGAAPVRAAARVESGAIALRFANGAVGTLAFTDASPSSWGFESGTAENPNIAATGQDFMWIAGTEGGVSFPSLTLWSGAQDWGQRPERQQIHVAKTDPLAAQLDHFLEVLDGAPPLIDTMDARQSLALTLEVERQASRCLAPQLEDA
jgi:predicted dehydrogenase